MTFGLNTSLAQQREKPLELHPVDEFLFWLIGRVTDCYPTTSPSMVAMMESLIGEIISQNQILKNGSRNGND